MSLRDPDTLRTTSHVRGSEKHTTLILERCLSRPYRDPSEPLVTLRVSDRGAHSYATLDLRDEGRDEKTTADLDVADLDELIDALRETRRVLNETTVRGQVADSAQRHRDQRTAVARC